MVFDFAAVDAVFESLSPKSLFWILLIWCILENCFETYSAIFFSDRRLVKVLLWEIGLVCVMDSDYGYKHSDCVLTLCSSWCYLAEIQLWFETLIWHRRAQLLCCLWPCAFSSAEDKPCKLKSNTIKKSFSYVKYNLMCVNSMYRTVCNDCYTLIHARADFSVHCWAPTVQFVSE